MSALRATGARGVGLRRTTLDVRRTRPGRGRGRPRPHRSRHRTGRQSLPLDDEPARVDLRRACSHADRRSAGADQHAVSHRRCRLCPKPVRFRPPSSSRHSRAQSTISQWCANYCRPSVPVVMSCTTQNCRRCGASSCWATVPCTARSRGRRSSRSGCTCLTMLFARESTRWTRTGQRSSSTPRARPVFRKA